MQNKDGDTPLHLAVLKGHTDIVDLLLHQGVIVKVQNEHDSLRYIMPFTKATQTLVTIFFILRQK